MAPTQLTLQQCFSALQCYAVRSRKLTVSQPLCYQPETRPAECRDMRCATGVLPDAGAV